MIIGVSRSGKLSVVVDTLAAGPEFDETFSSFVQRSHRNTDPRS